MKKLIIHFWIALALISFFSQVGISQLQCNYKPETKEFVKVIDSLSLFFYNLKNDISDQEWDAFITDVNNGSGISSFNKCGENHSYFQDQYLTICSGIEVKANLLRNVIDPEKTMSPDVFQAAFQQEVSCYILDTIENNLEDRISALGRTAPTFISGGLCEREYRTCTDNAQSEYTNAIYACGGIALVGFQIAGWWGSGIGGLACLTVASVRKNNAMFTCFENYIDCRREQQ